MHCIGEVRKARRCAGAQVWLPSFSPELVEPIEPIEPIQANSSQSSALLVIGSSPICRLAVLGALAAGPRRVLDSWQVTSVGLAWLSDGNRAR